MSPINSIFFLSLLLCGSTVFAQNSSIGTDSKVQDYGTLENINNIQSDFIIKNNGTKNLYLLRADTKQGIKVRVNKKTIPPGDTSMLHIVIEPKNTGAFEEEIKLVTSADADPYILTVKGNIKSIKFDDKTACFYFGKPNKKTVASPQPIIITNNNKETTTPEQKPSTVINKDNKEDKDADIPPVVIKEKVPIVNKSPGAENELDRAVYKSNNITFLIDVSASMRDSLKLPLMKEALYTFISTLRDIDIVNIITYSDSVRIIKDGLRGDHKTELNDYVKGLKAKGKTMGAKAILFSVDVALRHYIESGNNQLFLITDGKFKFTDANYETWKDKVGDKQIVLSTVALGNDDEIAMDQLKEISKKGHGSFIKIRNRKQAKVLILEEVKLRSKI